MKPNLEKEGIIVNIEGHTKGGTRVRIFNIAKSSSPSSLSSPYAQEAKDSCMESGDDEI